MKVALYLEASGLPYELIPVDTYKGEQHTPQFLAINPNGKTPAIVDDGVRVFDSTAILLYLAEKYGYFAGYPEDRGELLSWLMFVGTGLGPFSGQSVHFRLGAPEKLPYAINRYLREAQRHYKVLDTHLAGRDYIVGKELTIVDISAWGWIDKAPRVLGDEALSPYPNIERWFASVNSLAAVTRVRQIAAYIDFKSEMDDIALRSLFPQNYAQ